MVSDIDNSIAEVKTQLPDSIPMEIKHQRVSTTQTSFSPHYAVPQGINLNVSTPMVTLTSVPAHQSHLILPSNLLKSDSVIYSGGSQSVTTTPVSHRLHTLLNTTNGTVLTTGKFDFV